jgi:hypothetical protein
MNKAEPPHLSMRGLFLHREFLLRTGAGGMVSAAALAARQRFAILLDRTGDGGRDFGIDVIATVAEFAKLLCVQWLPPF